ncbi:37340_t:CDS:2 [Gigaspora margarita]|uniref:37340_t:CDS:1 n=1 Tax=Gigaspora margarita TaxID=4874 RepID=A0ABM8W085_GIGMA|nr:37340_t:CDS:2 [Gigaspora margarita]
MANASSIEDVEFIKTLQNDNMYSINYSEIKNIKLVKLIDYGITVKGHWRDRIVLMKHISNLINRNNEALKQLLHKLSIIKHPNILQFLGTSIGNKEPLCFSTKTHRNTVPDWMKGSLKAKQSDTARTL